MWHLLVPILLHSYVHCHHLVLQTAESRSVRLGDNVTLMCFIKIQSFIDQTYTYWLKQQEGQTPVILVYSFFNTKHVFRPKYLPTTASIRVSLDSRSFNLTIESVNASDAGLYFCMDWQFGVLALRNGTKLILTGPEDASNSPSPTEGFRCESCGSLDPPSVYFLALAVISILFLLAAVLYILQLKKAMAARRGKVARRFSDTSLKVLVAAVRARARVLFPRSSKKVHGSLSKKAWLEVAEEVSRLSITPRTWIQCRKRFNDLTRSAREKAAHNVRERSRLGGGTTDVVALTPVEQSAMDICGTPREISIGDGEAGGFSKHGDCFTIVPLHTAQPIPVSIKTSPSPREVFQVEPSVEDKPAASPASAELAEPGPGLSEAQGPAPLGGTEQKPEAPGQGLGLEVSRRRALPFPGAAEWDDPRDPAIKRKMLEAHHRLYQVLEGLPKTLSAMSESMEESTSAMCGVVSHVISTLQSTLESTSTPQEGAVAEPPQPETPSPTLEALIEAQTAAVQALGADVCSALERLTGRLDTLVDRVDRGFETLSHLLRCALPLAGGSEEAKPSEGGDASGQASFALTRGACPPFPPSPPPRAAQPTPPNGQLSQGALAAGPAALPPQGPAPRARAARSQRSRPSQEPPALSCLTGGTSRRSGKVSWALALTRNQVTSNRSAITSENHLEEEEIHYTALNLSPTNRTRSAACQMVYAEVRQEALLKKNSLPTSCSSK